MIRMFSLGLLLLLSACAVSTIPKMNGRYYEDVGFYLRPALVYHLQSEGIPNFPQGWDSTNYYNRYGEFERCLYSYAVDSVGYIELLYLIERTDSVTYYYRKRALKE